ncbi:MAG: hypothetical protein QOE70_1363 [Chthoniobacter sp.]|jgi:glycosyltransferase involved in cell wall biosynthesis|nr:hypothetical protein [Chthoniobacter sp.]
MHILFIHQAFPAQFGQLGLELRRRYGWRCSYLIQNLSSCPTPSPEMLQELELHRILPPEDFRERKLVPWSQSYSRYLELGETVFNGMRGLGDLRPDLVVGHDGLGPTLFLREILDCPLINYCEYYFAPSHADISYRIDLPPAEPAPFYPRCINAGTLVSLAGCDGGYSPTHWQRDSFPRRFHDKIEVHFDGVDTELYRPGAVPRMIEGRPIPEKAKIVTFVARGLESMRGFDLFMRLAARIARERADVIFVVVGREDSFYSWDKLHTGQDNFKEWVASRAGADLTRFIFLPHLEPAQLAHVFRLSDLHVYLTVPFVLSWSLFNALSCGCVVLASDVEPVREVIQPGKSGLLAPLFDTDAQLENALRVLAEPAAFRALGKAGRTLMEDKYSLEVCVPVLKDYFERMTGRNSAS